MIAIIIKKGREVPNYDITIFYQRELKGILNSWWNFVSDAAVHSKYALICFKIIQNVHRYYKSIIVKWNLIKTIIYFHLFLQ